MYAVPYLLLLTPQPLEHVTTKQMEGMSEYSHRTCVNPYRMHLNLAVQSLEHDTTNQMEGLSKYSDRKCMDSYNPWNVTPQSKWKDRDSIVIESVWDH